MSSTPILNPSNTGAYDVSTVPTASDGRSRFALSRLPEGGVARGPAQSVAAAYERLLGARQAEAEPKRPEVRSVKLKWVGREQASGAFIVVDRGAVTAEPTFEGNAPTKYAKLRSSGSELVDDFLAGGDAWLRARDEALWDGLRALMEEEQPDDETVLRLNRTVAAAILLRHGIELHSSLLPQEHLTASLPSDTAAT
jgi:hypothetical protein